MLVDPVNGVRRLRFSVTFTTAVTTGMFTFGPNTSTVGYDVILFGVQIEKLGYPSGYIPTTTAQVTRAADSVTSAQSTRAAHIVSMTSMANWFSVNEATLVADVQLTTLS